MGLFWTLVTCTALVTTVSQAACPNKCSGHGACGTNDVCDCKQNWTGGDCSLRVCPYTRAWVDGQTDDSAHSYAECGNKGTCDRTTGLCVCDAGYTGSGCRRHACPNDCSGHGTCEFVQELSPQWTAQWDEEKIMGCACDPGYEGHDCSSKICPKGDDPVTSYDQTGMEQYVIASSSQDIYLTYTDPYGATWTTKKIEVTALSTDDERDEFCTNVQTALHALPLKALKDVSSDAFTSSSSYKVTRTGDAAFASSVGAVTTDALSDGGCKITFPNAPGTSGKQNILRCQFNTNTHDGSQPILVTVPSDSECETGEFSSDTETVKKLTELATCSNRGLCDGATGDCQCFAGHRGLACETQEALV